MYLTFGIIEYMERGIYMLTWEIQNAFYNDNVKVICGCDEAGRGPLAGPVFAAAVILPKGHVIEGL